MKLKVLSSSSAGNCYLLESETQALVIEAGVRVSELKKAVGFNLSKIAGCVITHEHNDHFKYANEYMKNGIDCYMSAGTAQFAEQSHRINVLQEKELRKIGQFKVLTFDVQHDAAEPFGYLIYHDECGSVLFATDTYYLKYRFPQMNNILIEANYDAGILEDNYVSGRLHQKVFDRVVRSHMSIDQCIETLKANDLKQVNNIVLIHLSSGNGDSDSFKRMVEGATGKQVYIAQKGMTIDFNKTM